MIVSLEKLVNTLQDGELAHVSADFWFQHQDPPRFNDVDPNSPIWAELRAFQWGWARCKEFYAIKD
jgi:hypothetical protein